MDMGTLFGIIILILDIVGIVWLGILLEHIGFTFLGYIIIFIVLFIINANIGVGMLVVTAAITIIAGIAVIIRNILWFYKDKRIQKKAAEARKREKEWKQQQEIAEEERMHQYTAADKWYEMQNWLSE